MILKKLTAQDANTIAEQFLKNKYHDRGMLKWQGFFLSDHTSAIKKEVNSPIPRKRAEMSQTEISECLSEAWKYGKRVILQLNQVNTNDIPTEVKGYIKGYQAKWIWVAIHGELHKISLKAIKNCQCY
ncbi:hypothetical protein CNR30_00715 [Levilactobacillus brevis]|uniref:hypothetical protein n=1 Tax=Levilactobacillus brevis TaxID=1580 RepID=UPI000693B031|nr:hypothetical protein [Levilactobacillus brevis]RDF15408.1 hypothetical protein CNR30_00715 [Levilactobacillus brevis]